MCLGLLGSLSFATSWIFRTNAMKIVSLTQVINPDRVRALLGLGFDKPTTTTSIDY